MLEEYKSLKQLREDKFLTRREVSLRTGLSEQSIYLYETDLEKFTGISIKNYLKLCDVLGIPFNYYLDLIIKDI